jgi:hypothetical protein
MVPGGPREIFYGSAHCQSRVDVVAENIIGCSLESAGLIKWKLNGMLLIALMRRGIEWPRKPFPGTATRDCARRNLSKSL